MSESRGLPVAAAILAGGLIISAFIVGAVQTALRFSDRTVTVKGLVERDVSADTAVWHLGTSAAGNELAATQAQMEKNTAAITFFLKEKGFRDEEISLSPVRVLDRQASQYGEQKAGQTRFIIQGTVGLRSGNVDLVQKVSRLTNELVRAGITLSQESGCTTPSFYFTKLNDIKPEMLVEATQKARKAAEQFANDSGSRVGKIRRAWQGTFSIAERDQAAASAGEDGGYNSCNSDPNKRVRVVTTVDYYLE
jgi:uncharacterized protein